MVRVRPEIKEYRAHQLREALINYKKRGHSTFKCKHIAKHCELSAPSIGKFYIKQFIDCGMIEQYARTARGYRYRYIPEYFKGVV